MSEIILKILKITEKLSKATLIEVIIIIQLAYYWNMSNDKQVL